MSRSREAHRQPLLLREQPRLVGVVRRGRVLGLRVATGSPSRAGGPWRRSRPPSRTTSPCTGRSCPASSRRGRDDVEAALALRAAGDRRSARCRAARPARRRAARRAGCPWRAGRRPRRAARRAPVGSEPSRPRGVSTGSAGSNGDRPRDAGAAAGATTISRHSTSPREPTSARMSHAASTAQACARSGRRAPCSRARPRRAASSADRLRLALKTAFIVSIVKPGRPSPSVPASRCSACTSPSRVRSSRGVPSGADDAREARQAEARARQPVGVVGVLHVVAPRRARERLRAEDALGDRVAVVAPRARRLASRRAGSRPRSAAAAPSTRSSSASGARRRRSAPPSRRRSRRGPCRVGRDHVDPRVALDLRRRAAQPVDRLRDGRTPPTGW